MKPTTFLLNDSSVQGFNPRCFYGARFLGPLANEIESDILDDHVLRVTGEKTLIRVLTSAPITKASA